jgi:hypothetical protein
VAERLLRFFVFSAVVASILVGTSNSGVAQTWLGITDQWNNPENWSGGVVPNSATADVVLTPTIHSVIRLDGGPWDVRTLTVANNFESSLIFSALRFPAGGSITLQGSGSPSFGSDIDSNGFPLMFEGNTSGSLGVTIVGNLTARNLVTVSGNYRVVLGSGSFANLANGNRFAVSGGGTLYFTYDISLGAPPAQRVEDYITVNGGSLDGGNLAPELDPNRGIIIGSSGASFQSFAIPGNDQLSGTGPLTIAGSQGSSYVRIGGDNSDFSGSIVVNGQLDLANASSTRSTGIGAVIVNGSISGYGGIRGDTTIHGFVEPGLLSHGDKTNQTKNRLYFGADVALDGFYGFTFAAYSEVVGFSQIFLTDPDAHLTLGPSTKFYMDYDNIEGAGSSNDPFWKNDHDWRVIDVAGVNPVVGQFQLAGIYEAKYGTFSVIINGGDGNDVVLRYSVVPEPKSAVLLFSAGLIAGLRGRGIRIA